MLFRPAWVAALGLATLGAFPLMGQGESWLHSRLLSPAPASGLPAPLLSGPLPARGGEEESAWQLEPVRESSPAWLLALWYVAPYAELQAAELPLPPTPAEVETLPATQRAIGQSAIKSVWLQRLIRAAEERNRVSRENLAQSALLADKLAAPAPLADLLRRQATGTLSPRERYLADMALQHMLAAYGVDEREVRFFVDGCGLPPEQLREIAPWLPLPVMFNVMHCPAAAITASRLSADFVAELAVRRDMTILSRSVTDRASADAAAEAMLPLLARYVSALPTLFNATDEQRASVLTPYARYASPVLGAWAKERTRLKENDFYGSSRLKVLDYLFH